jgi:hypothetical protein
MDDARATALYEEIMSEADGPEFWARLAAEEAARTDPWRWACRLCGATGGADERHDRNIAATAHLNDTPCGRGTIRTSAEAGRLLHVWSYG